MLLNFINSSKKLLNIPHHQNEEKNLNLLETFSKYFGAHHIKALILKLLSDFRIVRAISLLRKLEHVSNV